MLLECFRGGFDALGFFSYVAGIFGATFFGVFDIGLRLGVCVAGCLGVFCSLLV